MRRLAALYRGFLTLCGLVAGITIAALAVMVSLDVLVRNLGVGNFPWLLEIAEYAIYVTTFLAAPWVLHQGAHVRVDLLLRVLPAPMVRRLELATDATGLVISLVVGYYGWQTAVEAYHLGSLIIKELVVPEWWLLGVIPLPALLLATEFALRMRRVAIGLEPAPAGSPRDGL